jgi:hypothetical protein
VSEIEQVTVSMNGFEVNSYVVHAPRATSSSTRARSRRRSWRPRPRRLRRSW